MSLLEGKGNFFQVSWVTWDVALLVLSKKGIDHEDG